MTEVPNTPDAELKGTLRTTGVMAAALIGVLAVAGGVVDIGGAVVAPGDVATSTKSAQISHPTGGVLARLMVREGQRVAKDQPLMIMDDRVSSIGAAGAGEDLDTMVVRRARLEAERDGMATFAPPSEIASRDDASARSAIDRERRQFHLDRASAEGQKAQLRERIHQSEEEISSLRVQIAASARQREIIEPERAGMKSLWDRRLVALSRLNQLERTAVDLDSNGAALTAKVASTRARIAEIRQTLLQVDDDMRTRAGSELNELSTRIGDARTRAASASDQQRRTVLRAPAEGIVDSLPYQTVGSSLPAGQPLVRVTPDRDRPMVEVSVTPQDVDQVRVGQKASLRFSGMNAQTTPQIDGRVEWLSAERIVEERTGAAHYTARIRVDPRDIRRLGMALRPGMPVEAYIATGDRSLLSYLLKPLSDQVTRAFREGD